MKNDVLLFLSNIETVIHKISKKTKNSKSLPQYCLYGENLLYLK